jgi:hypothetical protein
MPDSSAIDQALMDKVLADTGVGGVMTFCPDGVFWDEAGPSLVDGQQAKRFVLVSLVDAVDEPMFGATAFEDGLFAVKAVILSTIAGGNPKAAAARLQALLHFGTLTIPGYGLMVMRRRARIRITEVDDQDSSIRWWHRGGHYQVMAAPAAA